MLVPDILTVPPPSRVERMPMLLRKQLLLMSSRSSPGAEHADADSGQRVEGAVGREVRRRVAADGARVPPHALLPAVAVVLATAMTSGYVAGTWSLTSSVLSFPAATTTGMPA
jgi:hypothetical protein